LCHDKKRDSWKAGVKLAHFAEGTISCRRHHEMKYLENPGIYEVGRYETILSTGRVEHKAQLILPSLSTQAGSSSAIRGNAKSHSLELFPFLVVLLQFMVPNFHWQQVSGIRR